MKSKLFKRIGLVLLGALVIMQFIRPGRNEGNAYSASDITQVAQTPPEVKAILEKSCFDCHSNHTNYPWYTQIQPVGWWMQDHVNEGKEELNFSEFASYTAKRQAKKWKEIKDEVEEHEMPLESYLWIHKDAALNPGQLQTLLQWANQNSSAEPATEETHN